MTEPHDDEKQLWVRRLVDRHQTPLIRYARSIVGDSHTACDIVQETFLRLCRQSPDKLAGYEAAWLFRVCHNCALNHHRKDRRMTTSSETAESLATADSPGCSLTAAEDEQQLGELIDGLSEKQQMVVRLKFLSELKYREIAEATGLSESNVGFLLHTALQTMRERLHRLDLLSP